MQLNRGQRLKLSDIMPATRLRVDVELHGLKADVACFGLDAQGQLSDERYMIFYNQPRSPCGSVALANPATSPQGTVGFDLILDSMPASIERLVFTAALDGAGNMRQLQHGQVVLRDGNSPQASFALTGQDFDQERALMLLEIYRKDGIWRVSATGQGFNGGLAALVKHFGGEVAEEAPGSTQAPPQPSPTPTRTPPISTVQTPSDAARVSLEKRVEKEAPHLVSLVKKVGVSLDKAGLTQHRAKVALCLDISGSMHKLYDSGKISAFTQRILALAARFDDDGELDVFLFGEDAHQPPPMQLANSQDYIQRITRQYPLEGGTDYGKAIAMIRRHYFPRSTAAQGQPQKAQLPVYVMFLTDGQTSNEGFTERQITEASYEPIFWQFMGIGKSNKSTKQGFWQKLTATDFSFLEKLDTMNNRFIDNASFFSVEAPDQETDEGLYDLLLTEYKEWIPKAKQLGLLS